MSNPNQFGNGNNGDSSSADDWEEFLRRVESLNSSKIDIDNDVDDEVKPVDKKDNLVETIRRYLAYDDTGIDDYDDTGKDDPEGVPVGGQPNKPNDSKDTGKDDPEDDEDNGGNSSPESVSNKGNNVHNIMDRFKKSGIGKIFVRGCLVAALVGAIGGAYHRGFHNGAANTTAKMEANINEMEAKINEMEAKINSTNESQLGSDGATKELDRTATATESNAEVDTEKTDKSVDVVTADGRVIESVNFELGGDNSGADMIDRSLMESSHFGALTTKPAEWLNGGEGAEYRAAEGNADAMDSLLKKSLEEFNSHAGDAAVLVQEAYSLGYVDKAQMSLEQKGADTIAIMKDNAKYNDMKSFVEQKKIELEKNMGHGLMLLTDGQHYVSPYIRAVDAQGNLAKSVSEIDSVSHHVDKSVNPYKGGVLVITDVVQGTNLNYYEANPEAKEMGLRDIGLIAPDASEAQIKEAMKKYILLGHEAGCKQLIAVEVTPKDTSTYKVEYKTPEKSSSTSTSISITPELPGNPDPKLDDGSGIYKEEGDGSGTHKDEDDSSKKIIRRIYRGGNHHDDSSGIHESDKKKDDETPKETPKNNPGETPKETPGENPKETPGENPKDNEKVLEAKTDIVHVSREDNLQKDVTVSNQTDNVLLDHVTESMPENVSGDEVVDNTAAGNAAVDLYEATNENGAVDNDKSISTASGAENLNTGATEKQSDAEGVNKVEEVKESVEKVPDTSYDLGYASAEWDFSNFGN